MLLVPSRRTHSSQQQPIVSETTTLAPTRYEWNIPEAQTESADNGRRAWKDLESSCYNLQCQKCRKDCFAFIYGLHDAVNIKLGKPVGTPNNFAYLSEFIDAMTKKRCNPIKQ